MREIAKNGKEWKKTCSKQGELNTALTALNLKADRPNELMKLIKNERSTLKIFNKITRKEDRTNKFHFFGSPRYVEACTLTKHFR